MGVDKWQPPHHYFASKISLSNIRLAILVRSKETWSNSPPVFVGSSIISLINAFLEGLFGSELPALLVNFICVLSQINGVMSSDILKIISSCDNLCRGVGRLLDLDIVYRSAPPFTYAFGFFKN